jgi:hypothetical protein
MVSTEESDNKTYFLYALIKEGGKSDGQTLTNLRIVYWAEDDEFPAGFVIYGDRTPIGSDEEYITYRLQCYSIAHVLQFVKTILVPEHTPVIEMHQFVGVTDESEDAYNIDWQNTPEDKTTEILAPRLDGNLDFQSTLENILHIIENVDVV